MYFLDHQFFFKAYRYFMAIMLSWEAQRARISWEAVSLRLMQHSQIYQEEKNINMNNIQ